MRCWPSSFTQCIFVSTRLRLWKPPHFLQSARPNYFDARSAPFLATEPAVLGFQNRAFFRCGMTASVPQSAPVGHVDMYCQAVNGIMAIAGVIGAVCCDAPISWSAGIWLSSSDSIGGSLMLRPVASTARTSNVFSSILRWILRQTCRPLDLSRFGAAPSIAYHTTKEMIFDPWNSNRTR
jgi:hypothetical protein